MSYLITREFYQTPYMDWVSWRYGKCLKFCMVDLITIFPMTRNAKRIKLSLSTTRQRTGREIIELQKHSINIEGLVYLIGYEQHQFLLPYWEKHDRLFVLCEVISVYV